MTATQVSESRRQSTRPQSSLETIVVGTDLSTNAAAALEWAIELASAHGARIVLAHAIESDLPMLTEAQGQIVQNARRKMDTIHGSIEASKVEVQTRLDIGNPWETIAMIAKEVSANLIIVGAHGESRFSEHVLGTVADRLIKTTSTPVLVHRASTPRARHGLQTVLAATDFSEESALAISTVVHLLRGSTEPTRLVLFHTVALAITPGDFATPVAMSQYWDEEERTARRRLESLAASLRSDRLQVEVKSFRGYPGDAILYEAQMINADLIAIGTGGRTGMNRFFMGSVAERVLHHAMCSVLTVRKPGNNEPIRLSAE
jgi:nucleotide-binding universal stress UspA family protein